MIRTLDPYLTKASVIIGLNFYSPPLKNKSNNQSKLPNYNVDLGRRGKKHIPNGIMGAYVNTRGN